MKHTLFFSFLFSVLLPYGGSAQLVWSPLSDSRFHNLQHIHFADDRVGIACQQDTVFFTRDGGFSWSLQTIPGIALKKVRIFVEGGDTLYVAAGKDHNEVYYGHGFNGAPVLFAHSDPAPLYAPWGMTDVVRLKDEIIMLGYFADSATGRAMIYTTNDFGNNWTKRVFPIETHHFVGIKRRGGDTLCVVRSTVMGGIFGELRLDDLETRLNQFPVMESMAKGDCQIGGCLFTDDVPNDNLFWYRGNPFNQPVVFSEHQVFTFNDIAFYSRDEALVLKRGYDGPAYSILAYHMVDTGYDAKVEYVMQDSTKPLHTISVTNNYVYVGSSDVIYKAVAASIGLPLHKPPLDNMRFFYNKESETIEVSGIETNTDYTYQIVSASGQLKKEGEFSAERNAISLYDLKNQFYLLLVQSHVGRGYQSFKFVK